MSGWHFLAQDRMIGPFSTRELAERAYWKHQQKFAFDKSVRTTDVDGKLHVSVANLSKANVCGYMGKEIPDAETLGLEPEKIYQLFRAPEELAKAVPSANNLQLLMEHVPVDVNDHQPDLTVGSTGTDAVFNDPYLQNSLVVWAKDAIHGIEDGSQKELSCGYRYRADMTPGEYKGVRYDGVMRDIVFNHVALVKEGRAGADVVVGDSAIPKGVIDMAKTVLSHKAVLLGGALSGYLMPRLAQDTKVNLTPILKGITAKNYDAQKPAVLKGLTDLVTPLLAKDAKLDHLPELLDHLGKQDVAEPEAKDADNSAIPVEGEDEESDEEKAAKMEAEAKDKKAKDKKAALDNFLKEKLSAEDMAAYDAMCGADESEAAEENAEGESKEDAAKDNNMVNKAAMDSALKSQRDSILKQTREAAEAREFVQPWVGKVSLALDSAPAIYRAALKGLGMDSKKVESLHDDALKPILEAQSKPGEKVKVIAEDSMPDASGFSGRFANAGRIGLLG